MPFLRLPAEMRNHIYQLCLSFRGVETFFDTYYSKVEESKLPDVVKPPKQRRSTPVILLICRQVFSEAISLLQKKSVTFSHGLLEIRRIDDVISEHALRRVGRIEITVSGHPILQKNILPISWSGYMFLFTSLAAILSQGHSLKKLLIDLSDEDLKAHTIRCWHSDTIKCDFRDQLHNVLDSLREIRGVGHVEIKGIDLDLARRLKLRMESKPATFLGLPGEIRNQIYAETADWTDISEQLSKTMSAWTDRMGSPTYPEKRTPTILLLNKQLNKEAIDILRAKPLKLVLPDDQAMQKQAEVPNVLRLISIRTLQRVQHLSISVKSWEWLYSILAFLPVLATKHSLKSFEFDFRDQLKGTFLAAQTMKYPDKTLHKTLSVLANIRGVPRAVITGDLPDVYARPLAQIMQSPKKVPALKLQAICGNGEIVDASEED